MLTVLGHRVELAFRHRRVVVLDGLEELTLVEPHVARAQRNAVRKLFQGVGSFGPPRCVAFFEQWHRLLVENLEDDPELLPEDLGAGLGIRVELEVLALVAKSLPILIDHEPVRIGNAAGLVSGLETAVIPRVIIQRCRVRSGPLAHRLRAEANCGSRHDAGVESRAAHFHHAPVRAEVGGAHLGARLESPAAQNHRLGAYLDVAFRAACMNARDPPLRILQQPYPLGFVKHRDIELLRQLKQPVGQMAAAALHFKAGAKLQLVLVGACYAQVGKAV